MILENQDRASFITPRLRVFLSVDLIGSTAFKIRAGNNSTHWASALLKFYSEFQNKFFENWAQWKSNFAQSNGHTELAPDPELWKALGDELVFWKECRSPEEVCGVVQVWRRTLSDFKKGWSFDELRFKSGAWLVGSPIRNREVGFLREARNESDNTPYLGHPITFNFHILSQYYDKTVDRNIDIDFVGPSMDCGFRLLALVSEEKFIISADLAYVMATQFSWWEDNYEHGDYPPLEFHVGPPQHLAGVTRADAKYPIVWLSSYANTDLSEEVQYQNLIRESLGQAPQKIEVGELQKILRKFLTEVGDFPEEPYICKQTKTGIKNVFKEMPQSHADELNEYRQIYVRAVDQDKSILDALSENKSLTGGKRERDSVENLLADLMRVVRESEPEET